MEVLGGGAFVKISEFTRTDLGGGLHLHPTLKSHLSLGILILLASQFLESLNLIIFCCNKLD